MKTNPIRTDYQHFNKTHCEDLCTFLPWRCGSSARYFNPIEVTTDA